MCMTAANVSNILECAGMWKMCPISWNVANVSKTLEFAGLWKMCPISWNVQDCGKCVQYLGRRIQSFWHEVPPDPWRRYHDLSICKFVFIVTDQDLSLPVVFFPLGPNWFESVRKSLFLGMALKVLFFPHF